MTTLDLSLRPSLLAVKLLSLIHGIVALLLMFTRPTKPIAVGVAVALIVSWAYTRRHPAFGYGRRAIVRLIWPDQGPVRIARPTEVPQLAQLLARSVITSRLICLQFRLESGAFRSRILLGDEVEAEPLRRLRARLLLARSSDASADDSGA